MELTLSLFMENSIARRILSPLSIGVGPGVRLINYGKLLYRPSRV